MKVRVPMMVQDPRFAAYGTETIVEGFDIEEEPYFLNGPVSERVAVLDFDSVTGKLVQGARFVPPPPGRVLGKYDVGQGEVESRPFNQVSAFSTVLKTMYMYEEPDVLGRRLRWAFDSPQLLVIPRAGLWENAYYERDSRSLQFFSFKNPFNLQEMIHTSLSRDIVAHETGHAILDGICPHLYNAITPQSLALHEAIADITALLMSIRSRKLVELVLKQTGGSIDQSTHFSSIAEQFGMAMGQSALRNLLNHKTLDDVNPVEPHALSEVLTGAFYSMLMNIFNRRKKEIAEKKGTSEYSASGKALVDSANQFKRMLLRALDYLPPGEVSFADYGRAFIAADQVSHPDDTEERDWIRQEFVRRKIIAHENDLQVPLPDCVLDKVELVDLLDSNWAAYEFANQNRSLLGIPNGISFQVEPRLKTSKQYWHRDEQERPFAENVPELIFKVYWNQEEPSGLDRRFPSRRQITVGTTLAVDWITHRVRVLLSCARAAQKGDLDDQEMNRNEMARSLVERGLVRSKSTLAGPHGRQLHSSLNIVSTGDVLRIRGASRLLHIIQEA